MKISELFCSINGESKYSGIRTIFIRTYGCNCFCSFCDSLYTLQGDDYKEMTVSDIVEDIEKYHCRRVTITGGEPLLQEDARDLVEALLRKHYFVEIETNGAVDISPYINYDNVLITMDWKCPSSKMNHKMIDDNLGYLRPTDVIKFVVGSQEDLQEMERISLMTLAESYVSPVFGKIELKDIAEYIINNGLNDVRMQLQLHKLCWDPNMRGV